MDVWVIVLVLAAVFVATVAQSIAGFGFALIVVPAFVAVLDVRDAIVLTSLVGIINNSVLAWTTRRHVPWGTVTPMLAGAFVGMPVGLAVLLLAPPDAIRVAVGVATIVIAGALAAGLRFRDVSVVTAAAVGGISGLLNTSVGINGPPVVLYLQGRDHAVGEFRGALAVFFFVSNVIALAIFVASMIVSSTALALWAAAVPVVAAGSFAGHQLVHRVDAAAFRRLVYALLLASALSAIGSSLARIAG